MFYLVPFSPQNINHCVVAHEVTSSKCKEEALVWVLFQQVLHSPAHSLISLVDELLTEVAVYLLGSNTFMGWQCSINEIWDLRQKEKKVFKKGHLFQADIMHRLFAPSLNVAIALSLNTHPVGQNPKKAKNDSTNF